MWIIKKVTYCPIGDVDLIRLKKDLYFEIPHSIGSKKFATEKISLYSFIKGEKDTYIIVPRFYPEIFDLPYKYCWRQPTKIELPKKIQFISKNQEIVYDALKSKYTNPNGCVLILAPGQGKTYIGGRLSEDLSCRTLIVVNTVEIGLTWMEVLQHREPGMIGGGRSNKQPVTVGVIKTLIKKPSEWFDFDLVIYDEITTFTSDKHKAIFDLAPAPYLLGLTATPDTKKRRIFEYNVGPLLYAKDLNGFKPEEVIWRVNVKAIRYYGPKEFTQRICSKIGYTSACEMDKQFMSDPARNKTIAAEILKLEALGKNIFVFVSLCEAAEVLREYLSALKIPIYILMGKEKTLSVNELLQSGQCVIITTYHFCSKGISIPKMDAIVLYHPRVSDTEQVIGRITRIGGDQMAERYIIDIIDARTTIASQYNHRKKIYEASGYTITETKIKF